jgi:hypothetical protein
MHKFFFNTQISKIGAGVHRKKFVKQRAKNFYKYLLSKKKHSFAVCNGCHDPDLTSLRIRIQEGKPMRIHADPDPDQNLPSLEVKFFTRIIEFM